jgi:ParB-like chromosome segregation protein Spo0J
MAEVATQTPLSDLVPDAPPSSAVEMVPISVIDFEDIGPAPEPVLEELIRAQGILTPLTLARRANGRCELIAGRRRLRVARKLGLALVPALVIEYDGMVSVSALTDHASRRDNPAADLAHIERLVHRGASFEAISKATGLPVKTIKERLVLGKLTPTLRESFDRGKLVLTVAQGAARLPAEAQRGLSAKLEAVGRLTQQDVKEAKAAAKPPAPPRLPEFELDDVDPQAAPPIPASQARVTPDLRRMCRDLISLFRSEQRPRLAEALEQVLLQAGID